MVIAFGTLIDGSPTLAKLAIPKTPLYIIIKRFVAYDTAKFGLFLSIAAGSSEVVGRIRGSNGGIHSRNSVSTLLYMLGVGAVHVSVLRRHDE